MSRLIFDGIYKNDTAIEDLRATTIRRLSADPLSNCPIDYTATALKLSASQSCGKCVPCRVGIIQMTRIIDRILDGEGHESDLELLRKTAMAVYSMSDCIIGTEAGRIALAGLTAYRADYEGHLKKNHCIGSFRPVPCVAFCPAHVNVPTYIALIKEGRSEDAMRVIRNNNPFPSVCAFICEHPCENVCRRSMVDAPVNIRALKRAAGEDSGAPVLPQKCAPTGKRVAVIGGGPSGLTAAYYLALMGHHVTVFEQHSKLGGMLRYGIPRYRLPGHKLDYDIDAILSLGIEVHLNTTVGTDLSFEALESEYDSLFIGIGAHHGKSLGIEGEDAEGVVSAIEFLYGVEEGTPLDLEGKDVVVIGGGNVAMDASRTARRLKAASVKCVYRRRKEDMTAMPEEVEAACMENCEMLTLRVPLRVERGDKRLKLHLQPQMVGECSQGRPRPVGLTGRDEIIECDVIISAIGQAVEFEKFESAGIKIENGRFLYEANAEVEGLPNTFVGGDCATGPATVIRAIESGKVAAANIDELLGYHHSTYDDIEAPIANFEEITPTGRSNMAERPADIRVNDFSCVEEPLCPEEVCQESSRCLRCDHYGLGAFTVGRSPQW